MKPCCWLPVACLFLAAPALGADVIQAGKLELYPTWSAVGIELPYSGDDNQNARASFRWRREGEPRWHDGVDMTFDRERRLIWASVWPLEQAEVVHVHLTVSDPDGGSTDIKGTARLRKIILDWKGFREFYVSPVGNDTNPGTREQPFRTLGHAARLAKPGTVVYAMSGIYREGDLLAGARGTAEKPIVFAAASGETPILDGGHVLDKGKQAWQGASANVFVTEVEFDGGYVAQDGQRMFRYPTLAELSADKLNVKRAWYYDAPSKRLYVRTGSESAAAEHEYCVSRRSYGFHLSRSRHVIVRGFTVRNFGAVLVRISEGAEGCILFENKLHNAPGGIFMKSETTRDNAIWRNEIFEPGMDDISWNANYAYGYANQAIYCDRAGRGNSFCHNRIHNHFDLIAVESWKNPDKQSYNRDCDILFNELSNSGDDAIEVDGGGVNMRIHGNSIRQCQNAFSLAPIERGPVYVTRNTASFLDLLFKFNVGGCTSHGWTYVYHNSGYCLLNGEDGGTGISFPPNIPCSNKVLKNNIILANEWCIRAGKKGYELDGNCYFHVPGRPPRRFQWQKNVYATLTAFCQGTGQEKHGVYADPRLAAIPDAGQIAVLPHFADLPPRRYRETAQRKIDLHLKDDSPCLEAAVRIRGINDVFQGRGPDIGALEREVKK